VVVVVVVVVMGLMVKGTRILVVGPPKSWLRVPQKVIPRNPDKLAHAKRFSTVYRKNNSTLSELIFEIELHHHVLITYNPTDD